MRTAIILFFLGLPGCFVIHAPCPCEAEGICDTASSVPDRGMAWLEARTLNDDYEAATLSVEHATVEDDDLVRNDWDLLFGNDRDPGRDFLIVNTVTDDRSSILDLGNLGVHPFGAIPDSVDPSDCALGRSGDNDDVPVFPSHVYWVRTLDGDSRQVAAVQVVEHVPDHEILLAWCRSTDPDVFLAPDDCLDWPSED